ncbi:hypothetical protein TNCV_5117361 [Trichonephila clavipes]|nr:hypothetical protein TNCV_5117361 [Trichonephila clavipes]
MPPRGERAPQFEKRCLKVKNLDCVNYLKNVSATVMKFTNGAHLCESQIPIKSRRLFRKDAERCNKLMEWKGVFAVTNSRYLHLRKNNFCESGRFHGDRSGWQGACAGDRGSSRRTSKSRCSRWSR